MRFLPTPRSNLCWAEGDAPAAPDAGGAAPPPAQSPAAESLFPTDKPASEAPPVDPAAPPVDPNAKPQEGDKPPEEPLDKAAEKPPLELKLPEGVEANKEVLDAFQGLAAESGLTQEGAQKLLDLHFKALADAQTENGKAWAETQAKWETDLKADPILSKPEAKVILGKAFDEYGSPEARADFDLTGAGNSPAIARMIHKMAAALTEGAARPPPNPTKSAPKTPAQTLFPEG